MTKVTVDLADALRAIPYLAALDRAERAALAARCVTRAVPSAGVVLDLCRRRPEVALGVIAALARRVRAFAALVEDLALRDVPERVARLLAAEARRRGDTFDLLDTREALGARLGTVRERVSRALSALRAAGLITVRGRRVRVLDRARLAALASGDRESAIVRRCPDDARARLSGALRAGGPL
ncbi:MAG TPA: Crp/Fnr family transcriptional regulator [Methylomirabilota bacterium]|jgi:CRP/FNR family transcriptional regulator|nr:Crp/Fnr family transcriptional regulator [Methylomirabilota bacterium]